MSENAWRCTACGRVANAAVQPRSHVRRGAPCGPFAPAVVGVHGTVLCDVAPVARPTTYRQSLLRSFEICPRRALHELQVPNDLSVGNVEATADLGSAAHAALVEILATLRREGFSVDENGERQVVDQLSTQEGIEVMYETLMQGDWVLPTDERQQLREFVLSFCSQKRYRIPPSRIMALEQRLSLDLPCPDGKTRTLTGQPDVVLSDAPDGLVVIDFKTGRGKPPSPRQMPEDGHPIIGRQYLSVGGTYQLFIYGLLTLREYPRAQHVTLRELWLRFGEVREATLSRVELEHVEREIAVQMMLLDRAIDEGPDSGSKLTNPRPGRQCLRGCPVSTSCPIPEEQRGEGAISSPEDADENARRMVKVTAVRTALIARLKAWHEETGHCPEVGDGTQVRWEGEKGSRKFGAHPPALPAPSTDETDAAFVASMEAELARRTGGTT